jgi:hypothetical protein
MIMGLFGSKNTENPFAGRELLLLKLGVAGINDSPGLTILANQKIDFQYEDIRCWGEAWHYFLNNNVSEPLLGQGDWVIAVTSVPQDPNWLPWRGFGIVTFMSGAKSKPLVVLQLGRDGFEAFLSEIRWKKPGEISVYGYKSDSKTDDSKDKYIITEVRLGGGYFHPESPPLS